ncbi:MAG: phosphoribosylglycinamide synthetase, partial [Pseudomonadota bacterium]
GGAPMVRGVTDDKHLMKRLATALGVRTPPWAYYAKHGGEHTPPDFAYDALIVKPNASSASWGIALHSDWNEALHAVEALQTEGHDVIVEQYIEGVDLAVPVVGSITPWYLPVIRYAGDEGAIRTYEQKRDLVPSSTRHELVDDATLVDAIMRDTQRIVDDLWPFDHGRLEFRFDTNTQQIYFIEMNVNCNLWSQKTIASVAAQIGVSHGELIETIVCHSLCRQGVIARCAALAA